MQINNNYTAYNQPNFGKLKGIHTEGLFDSKLYAKEKEDVIRAFKESKGISELCEKYDVDAYFRAIPEDKFRTIKLDPFARVNLYVKRLYSTSNSNSEKIEISDTGKTTEQAFSNLSEKLRDVNFSDLQQKYLTLNRKTTIEELRKEYNDPTPWLVGD